MAVSPSSRLFLGLGMIFVLSVTASQADATPQSSLKLQIAAPECTLDTIDDGLGPVQVITCPPGTIDDPDSGPISDPDNNGGEGTGSGENGQSADKLQVSQRFESPADTLTLLDILQNSGMAIELPSESSAVLSQNDVIPKSDMAMPTAVQNSLLAFVAVTGVTAVVLGVIYPSIFAGGVTKGVGHLRSHANPLQKAKQTTRSKQPKRKP